MVDLKSTDHELVSLCDQVSGAVRTTPVVAFRRAYGATSVLGIERNALSQRTKMLVEGNSVWVDRWNIISICHRNLGCVCCCCRTTWLQFGLFLVVRARLLSFLFCRRLLCQLFQLVGLPATNAALDCELDIARVVFFSCIRGVTVTQHVVATRSARFLMKCGEIITLGTSYLSITFGWLSFLNLKIQIALLNLKIEIAHLNKMDGDIWICAGARILTFRVSDANCTYTFQTISINNLPRLFCSIALRCSCHSYNLAGFRGGRHLAGCVWC